MSEHKHTLDSEKNECIVCGMSIHNIELEKRIKELEKAMQKLGDFMTEYYGDNSIVSKGIKKALQELEGD